MKIFKRILYVGIGLLVLIVIIAAVSPEKDVNEVKSTDTDATVATHYNDAALNTNTQYVTYYIDSINGDDKNKGISEAKPWKTLNKVNSVKLNAGERVLLKRGGIWQESLAVKNSGKKDMPIVIEAYGSGKDPVLTGAVSVPSWSKVVSEIYKAPMNVQTGEGLGILTKGDVLQKFIPWDDSYETTFKNAPNESYSYEKTSNTIYLKTTVPPSNTYRVSIRLVGITVEDQAYVSIKNITIEEFSLNGIGFANCDGCTVSGGTIRRIGGAYIFNNPSGLPDYIYAGNGIDYSNSSKNGNVAGVTFSEVFDNCLAVETWKNNQLAENFTFANLTMDRCGFAGVEITTLTNDSTSGSAIKGITISSSTIRNSGAGWSGKRYGTEGHGIRIVADEGAGTITGVTIQKSDIRNSAGNGIDIAGEVGEVKLDTLSLSANGEYGIEFSAANAQTSLLNLTHSKIYNNAKYGIAFNAPKSEGLKIAGNTFYNNGQIHIGIFGQDGVANIEKNVFSGSVPLSHLYSLTVLSNPTIDTNCYTEGINMVGYNNIAVNSVKELQDQLGFEKNGIGTDRIDFVDVQKGNFTLTKNSICAGKGIQ